MARAAERGRPGALHAALKEAEAAADAAAERVAIDLARARRASGRDGHCGSCGHPVAAADAPAPCWWCGDVLCSSCAAARGGECGHRAVKRMRAAQAAGPDATADFDARWTSNVQRGLWGPIVGPAPARLDMPAKSDLLTTSQAATYLGGMTSSGVRMLVLKGRLKPTKRGARGTWMFTRASLDRHMEGRARRPR